MSWHSRWPIFVVVVVVVIENHSANFQKIESEAKGTWMPALAMEIVCCSMAS